MHCHDLNSDVPDEALGRMLRVREAPPVPDLSAAILDMAVPPQSTRGWWANAIRSGGASRSTHSRLATSSLARGSPPTTSTR